MRLGLEGKTALITAASGGIGSGIAAALADAGVQVAISGRTAAALEQVAGRLASCSGGRPAIVVGDVCAKDGPAQIAAKALTALGGRVDILVNNAGQMLLSEFAAGKVDEWRAMIDINLTGALVTTHVFLDQLRDGGGDIVNLSSVAGRKSRPTGAVYSATKWGIGGWSEGLRQEVQGDGVRVIVIEPGAVRTELADHISDPEINEATRGMWDTVEAMVPEDIAEVIAFAVTRPPHVALNEILIRPTRQPN
jgi:NADP-dependent 3-hydroxy acid dehydrogenase YdfG